MKNKKIIFIILLLIISYGLLATPVSAAIGPLVKCDPLKDTEGNIVKDKDGNVVAENVCTLNDFGALLARIATIILGVSGSLALLFFVYGGFVWLISEGNKEKVQKGKNILLAAVFGMVIIFAAYLMVEFTIQALTGQSSGSTILGQPWNE